MAQAGDTMAIDELVGMLAPFVGRITGPIALQDGSDAAQEALIAIVTSLKQLKSPEALWGWARTIAVREAIRTARRRRSTAADELPEVPARGDPQLAADVRDVLRRLSPDHRAVLVLRDLEGLDERAVGDVLAVTLGTVKSRLHRARANFRKAWER
jgi:RNA polymerase sigma factor (sigma-70 family)